MPSKRRSSNDAEIQPRRRATVREHQDRLIAVERSLAEGNEPHVVVKSLIGSLGITKRQAEKYVRKVFDHWRELGGIRERIERREAESLQHLGEAIASRRELYRRAMVAMAAGFDARVASVALDARDSLDEVIGTKRPKHLVEHTAGPGLIQGFIELLEGPNGAAENIDGSAGRSTAEAIPGATDRSEPSGPGNDGLPPLGGSEARPQPKAGGVRGARPRPRRATEPSD